MLSFVAPRAWARVAAVVTPLWERANAALQSVADERGLQLEVVEKPPAYTVSELREWWGGVRLLVGAHGSAMYNGGFFMTPGKSDVM